MTLPKGMSECPLCRKSYAALSNHLRIGHKICNADERLILIKLGTGRVGIKGEPCNVPGCGYKGPRVDKHLKEGHGELSADRLATYKADMKRATALRMLTELRATDPEIPMRSALDVVVSDEEDEAAPDEPAEAGCQACKQHVLEKARLQKELEKSRKEIKILSRRLRKARGEALSEAGTSEEEDETPAAAAAAAANDSDSNTQQRGGASPELSTSMASQTVPQTGVKRPAPKPVPGPAPKRQKASGPSTQTSGQSSQPPPPRQQSPQGEGSDLESMIERKGRASVLRKMTFCKSIEDYLNEYQKYQGGALCVGRSAEAAQSKVSRVRAFIYYMSKGKKDAYQWLFMADTDRVRQYVAMLLNTSRAVTTSNFYLRNLHQFLTYFGQTQPPLCRLSQKQVVTLQREINSALKGIQRGVTVHQIDVKRKKMSRIASVDALQTCQRLCKSRMDGVLDELEASLDQKEQVSRYKFYGHMAAFVASLYGHRPAILINMRLSKVAEAEREGNATDGYIINIDDHKTAQQFGSAQLYLQEQEFNWIRRWVRMRTRIRPKPSNDLVFCSAGKGPLKTLNTYLQEAWAGMGLAGKPTFTDLRTAISAHGKNIHGPEVRRRMSVYMCHNTKTADKFYALSLDLKQSQEMRRHFERTLTHGEDDEDDEAGGGDAADPGEGTSGVRPAKRRRPKGGEGPSGAVGERGEGPSAAGKKRGEGPSTAVKKRVQVPSSWSSSSSEDESQVVYQESGDSTPSWSGLESSPRPSPGPSPGHGASPCPSPCPSPGHGAKKNAQTSSTAPTATQEPDPQAPSTSTATATQESDPQAPSTSTATATATATQEPDPQAPSTSTATAHLPQTSWTRTPKMIRVLRVILSPLPRELQGPMVVKDLTMARPRYPRKKRYWSPVKATTRAKRYMLRCERQTPQLTPSPAGEGSTTAAERGDSPAERGASPAERGASPAERGASPAERGASPAERGASPAERGDSHAERGASPGESPRTQGGESPASQGGQSPAAELVRTAPTTERGESPASQGAQSPAAELVTTERGESPASQGAQSPAAELVTRGDTAPTTERGESPASQGGQSPAAELVTEDNARPQ